MSLTWAVWCHSLILALALLPHPGEVFLSGAAQISALHWATWHTMEQEVNFSLRHSALSAGVNDFLIIFSFRLWGKTFSLF